MTWDDLFGREEFASRHIGPSEAEIAQMLAAVGATSLDDLVDQIVPPQIRLGRPLELSAHSERAALDLLAQTAADNVVATSYIGLGYHPTITPSVIARNLFENPGWYTAYTPYQPEIAQGRLQMLLNFQQMVMDLTALPLAGASLLDEATAAAEAMAMLRRVNRSGAQAFYVGESVFEHTLDVVRTRAKYHGIDLIVGPDEEAAEHDVFGVLLQYPARDGSISDLSPLVDRLHQRGALVAVATDPLALVLLKPPGEFGADVAVGNTQRFGVPMGFGGPHAAFLACRDEYKRSMPGRLIGVSRDAAGNVAYRMALQTREQHIRREKATSNICTAQVLLANMAAAFAVWHGPDGLRRIAERVHLLTVAVAEAAGGGGALLRHAHISHRRGPAVGRRGSQPQPQAGPDRNGRPQPQRSHDA